MKLLLDSSYLLPLLHVNIEGISNKFLLDLSHRLDLELYYSSISEFELISKGMKIILSENTITISDIQRGIDLLQSNEKLISLPCTEHPLLLELSLDLRKIHNDTIDCIVFATAICYTECIASYDESFYNKIINNKEICEKIKIINPNFQFWFRYLTDEPLSLS
jgi:PIN domain nuclease of toxin-antitoxin system